MQRLQRFEVTVARRNDDFGMSRGFSDTRRRKRAWAGHSRRETCPPHTGEDCLPDTATPTLIVEPLDWSAAAARTVLSRQRLRRRAFRGLDTWDSTWNIDCSQPASNVREMSVKEGGMGLDNISGSNLESIESFPRPSDEFIFWYGSRKIIFLISL